MGSNPLLNGSGRAAPPASIATTKSGSRLADVLVLAGFSSHHRATLTADAALARWWIPLYYLRHMMYARRSSTAYPPHHVLTASAAVPPPIPCNLRHLLLGLRNIAENTRHSKHNFDIFYPPTGRLRVY